MKNLTSCAWFALAGLMLLALTSPVWASDDQLVYSERINNGWQDWGWVPHYATNNPAPPSGTNCMVFAASSGWQAWWLAHDPIDTTLYTILTLWLNGGSGGGQLVGVQAECSAWGNRIYVTAPTNSWQQFTFSLASLGVANITNLIGIQIWNNSTLQPNFCIANISLVADAKPALVHVGVMAAQAVRTVDAKVFDLNQVAWDGNLDTPTTVSILNDLGNPCLRWPGGSWGDVYHWTNEAWMTGATSARNWGSFSSDFIHVATNTSGQAFIIVNYGSSTPEEAAWGVRMFNVTNHCAFKYWEVGNEVGGSWEEDINTNPPWMAHDPWTYAMRFTDYYNQMKAVAPPSKSVPWLISPKTERQITPIIPSSIRSRA